MKYKQENTPYKGCADIDANYHVGHQLGEGAYGLVFKGTNKQSQKQVAIKQIKIDSLDACDAKKLYREMSLLGILKGHPRIVSLEYISFTRDHWKPIQLFLVFELYDFDLHHIIHHHPLQNENVRRQVLYQILSAIDYMHSKNFVHRDLKPGNVLVNRNGRAAICDFGFARSVPLSDKLNDTSQLTSELTGYVVTRWYRSPELLFGCTGAGRPPADMWSIGCILAEMLLKSALFRACDDRELFKTIVSLIGAQDSDDYAWVDNEVSRDYAQKNSNMSSRQDFPTRFTQATPTECHLLERLFVANPAKRISAAEALQHDYFACFNSSCLDYPPRAEITIEEQPSETEYYDFERQLSANRYLPLDKILDFIKKTSDRYRSQSVLLPTMQTKCGVADVESSDADTLSTPPKLVENLGSKNRFFNKKVTADTSETTLSTIFNEFHQKSTG